MQLPGPVVSAAWLAAHLGAPDLVVADCRFTLGEPDAGRQRHAAGHVPGAVYFDLERDVCGPEREHGGRHPLPDPDELAAKLGAAGIGPGVAVVACDEAGEFAARFWWTLRYLGHDAVAVLDGGFPAWQAAGGSVTAAPPRPAARRFVPRPRPEMLAGMEQVRGRAPGTAVVDSRAPERFAGQPHPLDARQGHIPGALNRFWKDALHPDGTYLPAAAQQQRLGEVAQAPEIIVHCGSGVTACPNLIAMELAGIRGARLYVGSWSDWCSYPENPVEK